MASKVSIFVVVVVAAAALAQSYVGQFVDSNAIVEAYEDVRNDGSPTNWLTIVYDGKLMTLGETGTDYDEFLAQLQDDNRVYGYVRFETGDEMSRRAKFAFITWIGPSVSPLKKAKVSTDKAFVKQLMPNFGKEILADERSEVKYDKILGILESASGAAYGTGQRALSLSFEEKEAMKKEEEELKKMLIKRLLEELADTI